MKQWKEMKVRGGKRHLLSGVFMTSKYSSTSHVLYLCAHHLWILCYSSCPDNVIWFQINFPDSLFSVLKYSMSEARAKKVFNGIVVLHIKNKQFLLKCQCRSHVFLALTVYIQVEYIPLYEDSVSGHTTLGSTDTPGRPDRWRDTPTWWHWTRGSVACHSWWSWTPLREDNTRECVKTAQNFVCYFWNESC